MRLIRCALAAATVAASASAIGLPLFLTDWMPESSDATQVRMVSAPGIARSKAESPQPPFTIPGPQVSPPPCFSYGGPYCGWVATYWGGCDKEWGLSYGFKNPDWICPHDPRPSPSATPSPSDTSASAGSSSSPAALSRLSWRNRSVKPNRSAKLDPTTTSGPLGHHGHRRKQQFLQTGPAERPPATRDSGGAHPPVAVEPQGQPREDDLAGSRTALRTGVGRPVPDRAFQADYVASLLQAVNPAAEVDVFACPTAAWSAGRDCRDAAPYRRVRPGCLPVGRLFIYGYEGADRAPGC